MLSFASQSQFTIAGRGTVHTVRNPAECSDFAHLIGAEVLIDGKQRKVTAVERFAHAPPWRKDEWIGLLVAGE